ncbi:MAG: YbjQ family protein [Phycisphaerae bacterium]
MILSTTDSIAGKRVVQTLGLVRGNTIRAMHIGNDITAIFRHVVGGEIGEYTKLMGESREQAIDRMVADAAELGADAIIGVNFCTSELLAGAAELVAYGTAVKLAEDVG